MKRRNLGTHNKLSFQIPHAGSLCVMCALSLAAFIIYYLRLVNVQMTRNLHFLPHTFAGTLVSLAQRDFAQLSFLNVE